MLNDLDTTIGGTTSNSYATLAEAETYLGARQVNDAWNGLPDIDKQGLLILATKQLDLLSFYGLATSQFQALSWPRFGMVTKEGYIIQFDQIPRQLKEAQAELAFALAIGTFSLDPQTDINTLKAVTVGDLSVTYRDAPITIAYLPKIVTQLLQPWLVGGSMVGGGHVVRG